jgi:DNA topoisomerase III
MTTLYLAEKPSQAMDIAKELGIKSRSDGYLILANDDRISWAVGHLLELAEPKEYNESWGGYWKWDQLPMIPEVWKYVVNTRTSKQFTVIKNLLKTTKRVVIATDAGREGELIAREILEHCKFKGTVERFWTSSLVAKDIRHALANLRKDSETYPLFEAARARSRSDFMLGLTGTRAVSLAANVRGDYFPVGRVKTPTLALVVKRDFEIANFVSKAYFELEARVTTQAGASFKMMHSPSEEHRVYERSAAEALKAKALGYVGPLVVKKTNDAEQPPLPYSLPMLQKDANRIYGFTARNTLKLAQELYEQKAATYPRTDCQYLAESQMDEVPGVLECLSKTFPAAVSVLTTQGVVLRKSTFNDAKLVDHHAIIPTSLKVELSGAALQLYTLICQQYLRALAPEHKFLSTKVSLDANGVPFRASGRTITSPGWKAIKLVTANAEEAED